jgi:hypothetical protein
MCMYVYMHECMHGCVYVVAKDRSHFAAEMQSGMLPGSTEAVMLLYSFMHACMYVSDACDSFGMYVYVCKYVCMCVYL